MSILDFGKKSDEKPMDLEYRQIPDGVGVLTWFEMETERIKKLEELRGGFGLTSFIQPSTVSKGSVNMRLVSGELETKNRAKLYNTETHEKIKLGRIRKKTKTKKQC